MEGKQESIHKAEIQSLMQELQARDAELNEMSASHSKQLEAWMIDKQQMKQLEEANSQMRGEVSSLKHENHALNQRIHALNTKLEDSQSRVENMRDKLVTTEDKLQAMTARWETTNMELDAVTERSNTSSALITELQDAMRAMREADSATREEMERSQSRIEVLQAEKDALERRIETVESSRQALEDRYRELSRQLESSKAKHNQTEATLTRKDYQITQLESSIEMQRRDLNKVNADLNKAYTDISSYQRDIALIDKELKLSQDRERRKDKLLELAKSKEERFEKELRAMRQAGEQADSSFASLTQQINDLRRQLHDREVELNIFRQARVHSKEDAAGVHNALNDMTRRLQHHVSDLKQATSAQDSGSREGTPNTDLPMQSKRLISKEEVYKERDGSLTASQSPPSSRGGEGINKSPGLQESFEYSDKTQSTNKPRYVSTTSQHQQSWHHHEFKDNFPQKQNYDSVLSKLLKYHAPGHQHQQHQRKNSSDYTTNYLNDFNKATNSHATITEPDVEHVQPQYQAGQRKRTASFQVNSHSKQETFSYSHKPSNYDNSNAIDEVPGSDLNLSNISTDTQDVEAVLAATADLLARTRRKLQEDEHDDERNQGRNLESTQQQHNFTSQATKKQMTETSDSAQQEPADRDLPSRRYPAQPITENPQPQYQQLKDRFHNFEASSPPSTSAEDLILKLRRRLQTLPDGNS